MPLRSESVPPCSTTHSSASPLLVSTRMRILPSSSSRISPHSISLIRSGKSKPTRLASPGTLACLSKVKVLPLAKNTLFSSNLDIRILGPCKSANTPICTPSSSAILRTMLTRSMCSCAVPCEKLMRTTLTPARIMSRKTSSDVDAGPSVATILVSLMGLLCCVGFVVGR